MLSQVSCRIPLRLKQDSIPLCQSSVSSICQRFASTVAPPEPIPAPKRYPRRSVRTATPTEKAYALKKRTIKKHKLRPMHIDPFTRKLMDARTTAIKARQRAALDVDKVKVDDNPIYGQGNTPFVDSLHLGMPAEKIHIPDEDGVPSQPPAVINTSLKDHEAILSSENTGVAKPDHLAHFISTEQLHEFGKISSTLSAPIPETNRVIVDPDIEAQQKAQHETDHATRMAAMARILAVENQTGPQRAKVNMRRIIDEFGRHKTDHTIDPRQRIRKPWHDESWTPKERIGPDTGSSEVQIGLLTIKIQALAKAYETTGKNDKINKRNLRLLLHRRQKLLAYFYKSDKAGERWQHMVEKLGVTDAMWKGEIEVR